MKTKRRRFLVFFIATTIVFAGLSVFLIASGEESVGGFRTPEGRAAYKAAYDDLL